MGGFEVFVPEVGKLRDGNLDKLEGGMWLWGADQLVLWIFFNEFFFDNILSCMWPLWRHDTTNIGIATWFSSAMTHVKYDDVVHKQNIEW